MTTTRRKTFGLLAAALLATAAFAPRAHALDAKWCSKAHIRFFVGGAEGDAYGTIVYNGARRAATDLGAQVDYVFSGWNPETMVQQLREAVAARPDGIAMMGHPGDAAIMPLAEQAAKAGIRMEYQNVDVPDVRKKFGGGYIGADLKAQGYALGHTAIEMFGLKPGDKVVVFGPWGQVARAQRELATVQAFEDAKLKVIKLDAPPEAAADPNLLLPENTAVMLNNPDAKLIAYPGGQPLGNVPTYMKAAGKKPGEVKAIGFDTSPQIIQAFDQGWVQLTSDQEPFLQGYLPILSLCQSIVLGMGPMSMDTGAGFVTAENYKTVATLAQQGLR